MNFDPETLNALAVNLHGRRIGVIHRISGDRHLFSFEQGYIEDANRPPLSLSFKGQGGGLVIPTHAVRGRLPVFFSNLLPEGHLCEYLAARGREAATRILSACGARSRSSRRAHGGADGPAATGRGRSCRRQ